MVGWTADILFARHGFDILVCTFDAACSCLWLVWMVRMSWKVAVTVGKHALQSVTATAGTAGTAMIPSVL